MPTTAERSPLGRLSNALDELAWSLVRGAVRAVRYEPRSLDLAVVCGTSQPEVPDTLARWLADARVRPGVVRTVGLPHRLMRVVADATEQWSGPTGSALIRWFSGVVAGAADRAGAWTIQQTLNTRAHPSMLVPHPHDVAVVFVDMRGFSNLTRTLDDSQYMARLVGEYLTTLTGVVERHRGVVFQYTGDGLVALFLPELAGVGEAEVLDRVVRRVGRDLHRAFEELRARWRHEWWAEGRPVAEIGLGVGVSFGRVTIGFIGPKGKKQFGVIGEPVNLAAFLCSQAYPGALLVDCESFVRAGTPLPPAKIVRLRSKKRHQRIATACLRYEPVPALPAGASSTDA